MFSLPQVRLDVLGCRGNMSVCALTRGAMALQAENVRIPYIPGAGSRTRFSLLRRGSEVLRHQTVPPQVSAAFTVVLHDCCLESGKVLASPVVLQLC